MRLKLVLAYVGTNYSGWQIQCKRNPPPTIQAALERALGTICDQPVRVFGAGRTDAGVHAHAQVAHVDVPDNVAARMRGRWQHSLNALLPQDIRILDVAPCAPRFHARNDAAHKTYHYQFWQERSFVPPALAPYLWQCGPLDVDAMRAALALVPGQRDFASLQNAGTELESTVRTVMAATLHELPPLPFYPAHAPMLCLEVTADGFLKQMVRNLAGLLVHVGRGLLDAAAIPDILAAATRTENPAPTAPPQGLFLVRVVYSDAATM